MSRDICIFQSFLTPAHKAQITAAAEAAGMTPYFFTKDQFNAARDCVQHCEVLYAASPDLLRTAPATLEWYCASSAGVDAYCRDESLFANPNCLLSNSNAYGVTIAEHTVMVTLMLLRQMPAYLDAARAHRWAAPAPVRSIHGCRVTILGTGDLGGNIARRMRGMGAEKIIGLSRSGKAREAGIFDETYPISQLDRLLSDAEVVKRIFAMTIEGYGPYQIASKLKEEKILIPSAYLAQHGEGVNKNKTFKDVYGWGSSTICNLLEKREYLGHTINFKTY